MKRRLPPAALGIAALLQTLASFTLGVGAIATGHATVTMYVTSLVLCVVYAWILLLQRSTQSHALSARRNEYGQLADVLHEVEQENAALRAAYTALDDRQRILGNRFRHEGRSE